MRVPMTPFGELRTLLRLTGLGTWLAVSAHALLAWPAKPERLTPDEYLPWGACLLGFALVFWLATQPCRSARAHGWKLALAGVEVVLALMANHIFNGNSLLSGLLLVVAVQVGILLPVRWALAWVGVQTLGLFAVLWANWPLFDAWSYTTGYLCFQVFGVLSAQIAVREVRARSQLAAVVEELRATRKLLAQASRDAERLRIARELHDLLGHHLTALNMNLEVAQHLVREVRVRTHVERAHALGKLLLSDVREAVRSTRDGVELDFHREVAALVRNTSGLTVHAQLPGDLSALDPVQARVLLRCVQEVLTNAARHASARNLWLEFRRTPDGLELCARDDGHGAHSVTPGCGLRGMRERLESLGGALHIEGRVGEGFALRASLPLARELA